MTPVNYAEREMSDAEFARMNAGFDEHTREHHNPVEVSKRYGFVAMDGELFIGCSSGLLYLHDETPNGWFFLTDLFVEKAYRGQGIGAALLALLEARVAALGVENVWTETAGYEAPGFYLKQGYAVIYEQERWFPSGHSRVALRKTLTTSS